MKIALAQNAVTGSPCDQLRLLETQITEAHVQGANLLCTQELFLTPYFCVKQDPNLFDFAITISANEPLIQRLCSMAKGAKIVLVASLFEKVSEGIFYNTCVIIDSDGSYLGKYRKSHIPQDPGFEEKFYFAPGDSGYPVWDTKIGKIGVLICWDQWYPEAARLMALAGADLILYPTAIGWQPDEKVELGTAQHNAWQTVIQGHAVANGLYVAAINRTGIEEQNEFWGQSFVANPYGEIVEKASIKNAELLLADIDLSMTKEFRRIWPFFRDRRIETYNDLSSRWRF